MSRSLELLAPAKNLECGIAAIDHGADAVYIGAELFGARASAGNSIDDIRLLCNYAHIFRVKVYVTVNTILYDDELQVTQDLIQHLYDAGVDALLVQDMGILQLDIPPITLHASTQTDNRTVEKVKWLKALGFSRVVLARELSLQEIEEIHNAVPDVELEVFVHGALCVCYSGLCYASEYCFKRSANRGECAQFCRLKFDLEDSGGRVIEHSRHLLSLKDMNQYDILEQLITAGATSFKIEGRLKDVTYVKNVTAAYSNELNRIIAHSSEQYQRASLGNCTYSFTPNLNKTFNRGFTHYFINGRTQDISSFDTPKAMGEFVGKVKEIRGDSFTVAGTTAFANGDGLCFVNKKRELEGFRVNKVVNNRIFPLVVPKNLKQGDKLYRNNDYAFEKLLSHKSGERKIAITMFFHEMENDFCLIAKIDGITEVSLTLEIEKQKATKPQRENIVKQLTKLGNTPFVCHDIIFDSPTFDWFIPSSLLTDLRRRMVETLIENLHKGYVKTLNSKITNVTIRKEFYPNEYSYLYNVSNRLARKFYSDKGFANLSDAFEVKMPKEKLLMQCRYCLRYSLGHCTKNGGTLSKWHEPLYLKLFDGQRFRLQFDCSKCQMNVYAEK
ncbi:MAG: U32 family peptidase [Prevotella sp.]|nr:U32 family peptidase [Prevotella sp.]